MLPGLTRARVDLDATVPLVRLREEEFAGIINPDKLRHLARARHESGAE
jgi:hypothetical protein